MNNAGVEDAWFGLSYQSGSEWVASDGSALSELRVDAFRTGEKDGATTKSRALFDLSYSTYTWAKRDYSAKDVNGFICEGFDWYLI